MLNIILSIFILVSAIPLGFLCRYLSLDEEKHYGNYFPSLLWILAISAGIFYSMDIVIALSLSFLFLLIFSWGISKCKNLKLI